MKEETKPVPPVPQDGNSTGSDARPARRGLIAAALGALAAGFAGRVSAAPARNPDRDDAREGAAAFLRFKNFKLGTKNEATATTSLQLTGGNNIPALTADAGGSNAGLGNASADTARFGQYSGDMPLNLAALAGESSPGQIGVYGNAIDGAGVWGGSDTNIGVWGVTNTGIGMLARATNPADPKQVGVALAVKGRFQHDMIEVGVIHEGDEKAPIPCPEVTDRSNVLVTLNSDVGALVAWVEILPGEGAVLHLSTRAVRGGMFTYWITEALSVY